MGFEKTFNKRVAILSLTAAVIIGCIYLASADGEFHFMEGASAIKILWARSLLAGQGYSDISRIGSPPEIVRPPGFALLVSAVVFVFGEDMLCLKIFNNAFAAIGCVFLFFLFHRNTGRASLSFFLCLAAYLYPHYYFMASYLEAEFVFCAFFYSALFIFERTRERGLDDYGDLVIFSIFLALACIVRTIGLILVPASALALFFLTAVSRRVRIIWVLVIIITWLVVGGGWMLRNQLVAPPGELTYVDKLLAGEPVNSVYWLAEDHRVPLLPPPPPAGVGDIARRLPANGLFLVNQLMINIWPGFTGISPGRLVAASAIPVALIFIGLFYGVSVKRRLLDFSTLTYLAVVLVWPYQDNRFLLPVAGFLILYFMEGIAAFGIALRRLSLELKPQVLFSITLVLVAALSLSFIYQDIFRLVENKKDRPLPTIDKGRHFRITSPHLGAYHSLLLLDWAYHNSNPTDTIMFHSSTPCALVTHRQCSAIPMVSPGRLMHYIDEWDIDFVVVDDEAAHGPAYMASFTPAFLIPTIEAFPGRFEIAFSLADSQARVLRVIRN